MSVSSQRRAQSGILFYRFHLLAAWRAYSNKEEGSLTAGHRIKEENRRLGIHTFILRLHSLRNNQKKGKRFEPVGWRYYKRTQSGTLSSLSVILRFLVCRLVRKCRTFAFPYNEHACCRQIFRPWENIHRSRG